MIALSAALAALIVLAFVGLVAVSLHNQSTHDIWW